MASQKQRRLRQLWRQALNRREGTITRLRDLKRQFSRDLKGGYEYIYVFASFDDKDSYERRFRKLFLAIIAMDPDPHYKNAHQLIRWILGCENFTVKWEKAGQNVAHVVDGVLKHHPEDWPKLRRALQIFEAEKGKYRNGCAENRRSHHVASKDIGTYQTPQEFTSAMNKAGRPANMVDWRQTLDVQIECGNARLIDENKEEGWVVAQILTKEGAIALGEHANWCTAYTDEDNAFDDYSDGVFWILNTKTNERYQISFQKNEYHDEAESDDFYFWDTIAHMPNLNTRLEELRLENFREIVFAYVENLSETISEAIEKFFETTGIDDDDIFATAQELYDQGHPHACMAVLDWLPDGVDTDEQKALYFQAYDRLIDDGNIDEVVSFFKNIASLALRIENIETSKSLLDRTRQFILDNDCLDTVLMKHDSLALEYAFEIFGDLDVIKAILKTLSDKDTKGYNKTTIIDNFSSFFEIGIFNSALSLSRFLSPDEMRNIEIEFKTENHKNNPDYKITRGILTLSLKRLQKAQKPKEPTAAPG